MDRRLRRFSQLLEVSRRLAVLREEQARELTRGWPVLRGCAQRLGAGLLAAGVLDEVADVFFLRRSELCHHDRLQERITERRVAWQRQRRLTPPLALGAPPRIVGDPIGRAVLEARGARGIPAGAVLGHPASSGRASGAVRIVRTVADFESGSGSSDGHRCSLPG